MELVVKEWPNKTATLMTSNGYALSLFSSSQEAEKAIQAWRMQNNAPAATSSKPEITGTSADTYF